LLLLVATSNKSVSNSLTVQWTVSK